MGEEVNCLYREGHNNLLNAVPNLDLSCNQTATVLGENIYVIKESGDEAYSSFSLRIFSQTKEEWVIPTMIGTCPVPSRGHSAVALDGERLLLLKHDSPLNDCAWLLEVDTQFVREHRKMLGTEVAAWSKGVLGDCPKPIVISGPSGVGKGTLISKLMKEFPSTFGFSVSHTTRHPRENEKDGIHYHFMERSKMEKDIQDGKFLETASVHGNLYGTSIEAVETVTDSGKRCILDIDVQGATSVRTSTLDAIFIFVTPPSFEKLETRLRLRATETEEQVQKRLRNARMEIEQSKLPGLFDYILVNDDLDLCYENLKGILGLTGTTDTISEPCPNYKKLPACCSVSRMGEKFIIDCRSKSLFILDASSLSGGAPGCTRGLYIHESDTQIADSNGI